MARQTLEVAASLDADLEAIPNRPAVFLVWAASGRPYLARTGVLRRRLKRLLGPRESPGRLLHLRAVAVRVDYWLTASRLAAGLLHYDLARTHFPDDYDKQVKLRWPAYLKLLESNEFPRTTITTRLSGSGLQIGPFPNRAAAEQFEQGVLDFFQVRRCQDDLAPSPSHPGCMYGEMNRCLRPCQQAVSPAEYGSEVRRLRAFLETNGQSLRDSVAQARDRLSEMLEFEEAARQQQRLVRIGQVLQLKDELATSLEHLNGVAVLPSAEAASVDLRFLLGGVWLPACEFSTAASAETMIPLDRRLKELAATLIPAKVTARVRQEHLALLSRWYFSSWRDGEWLAFESLDRLPYRKLVNAISRQVRGVPPTGNTARQLP